MKNIKNYRYILNITVKFLMTILIYNRYDAHCASNVINENRTINDEFYANLPFKIFSKNEDPTLCEISHKIRSIINSCELIHSMDLQDTDLEIAKTQATNILFATILWDSSCVEKPHKVSTLKISSPKILEWTNLLDKCNPLKLSVDYYIQIYSFSEKISNTYVPWIFLPRILDTTKLILEKIITQSKFFDINFSEDKLHGIIYKYTDRCEFSMEYDVGLVEFPSFSEINPEIIRICFNPLKIVEFKEHHKESLNNLKELCLSNTNLTELPSNILYLKSLEILDLSRNDIKILTLKEKRIRTFNTDNLNSDMSIKTDLNYFEKLKILNIYGNPILKIEINKDDIKIFKNLTELHLYGSKLEFFPNIISFIPTLTTFHFGSSKIKEFKIPDDVVKRLSNLKILGIRWCDILKTIDGSVFHLKSLNTLQLNYLPGLEKLTFISNMNNSNLKSSENDNFENSDETEKSPKLKTLEIGNCINLKTIDSSISCLTYLESLKIQYSPKIRNLDLIMKKVDGLFNLEILSIFSWEYMDKFPIFVFNFENLKNLTLRLSNHKMIKSLKEYYRNCVNNNLPIPKLKNLKKLIFVGIYSDSLYDNEKIILNDMFPDTIFDF